MCCSSFSVRRVPYWYCPRTLMPLIQKAKHVPQTLLANAAKYSAVRPPRNGLQKFMNLRIWIYEFMLRDRGESRQAVCAPVTARSVLVRSRPHDSQARGSNLLGGRLRGSGGFWAASEVLGSPPGHAGPSSREAAGPVHAPLWPCPKFEEWWILVPPAALKGWQGLRLRLKCWHLSVSDALTRES